MTGGQNDYDVNVSAPRWSTYSLQSKSCEYFLLHSLAQIDFRPVQDQREHSRFWMIQ